MTYTPTDVLKVALERRNVTVRDVIQKDDEIWLIHSITTEPEEVSRTEMIRLVKTFLDVYERYDDVSSLKVYCLGSNNTGYQICRYKQKWAREATEALHRGEQAEKVHTQALAKFIGTR